MTTTIQPAAKASYERDGFLLHTQPVIPADVLERANAGMDAVRRGVHDTGKAPVGGVWKPGDDPNKLCKIEQPQIASRAIFELISHPALGRAAAAVTGAARVQVWWVQLLYKPSSPVAPSGSRPSGAAGASVGWHQDRTYWGEWEVGSNLFTAWVALSDVRQDCGPMRFVRASHRWGLQSVSDFFAQDLDSQRAALAAPAGQAWEEVAAVLPPGGVSFHDNLTIHGSGPNVSGRPRRSLAVHLRTEASRPVGDKREGLTAYIDDPGVCPVIFGA